MRFNNDMKLFSDTLVRSVPSPIIIILIHDSYNKIEREEILTFSNLPLLGWKHEQTLFCILVGTIKHWSVF